MQKLQPQWGVPRLYRRRVKFDNQITICCMAFDLELEVTRQLVKEQGYLLKILESGTDAQMEQLDIVRSEIENAWGFGLQEGVAGR